MIKKLKKTISTSIEINYGKNIFKNKDTEFSLGKNLYLFIVENKEKLTKLDKEKVKELSLYTKDIIIDYVISINQYVLVNRPMENDILNIVYVNYMDIFSKVNSSYLPNLINNFQKEIINYLNTINELRAMDNGFDTFEIIPCSQYSPEYQLELLGIDYKNMKEPILDLGCGEDGRLVIYLRELGFKAYGIDRKISIENKFLHEISWFDIDFDKNSYGTIISHLSFTNHFKREHLKIGDGHILYGKKYMEILESLKTGGRFYYLPSLEFIEDILPKDKYDLDRMDGKLGIKSSVIYKK